MNRCFWKDCSGEVVGALAHTYAPEGWVWYCADHSPSSDHWRDQTLMALRGSADRIASALEAISRALATPERMPEGLFRALGKGGY